MTERMQFYGGADGRGVMVQDHGSTARRGHVEVARPPTRREHLHIHLPAGIYDQARDQEEDPDLVCRIAQGQEGWEAVDGHGTSLAVEHHDDGTFTVRRRASGDRRRRGRDDQEPVDRPGSDLERVTGYPPGAAEHDRRGARQGTRDALEAWAMYRHDLGPQGHQAALQALQERLNAHYRQDRGPSR